MAPKTNLATNIPIFPIYPANTSNLPYKGVGSSLSSSVNNSLAFPY